MSPACPESAAPGSPITDQHPGNAARRGRMPAHGVGRLVFTSSPSVTFDGRDQCGVDESAP